MVIRTPISVPSCGIDRDCDFLNATAERGTQFSDYISKWNFMAITVLSIRIREITDECILQKIVKSTTLSASIQRKRTVNHFRFVICRYSAYE
ncbi:hypothetical protein AVEN_204262-1 [Araneus ventricosus]|uniref:Uncharacterized protein n=1 Tax=Araneus ventricosus TaxID=182803 RepID=A0A4Y2RI75_ARAVE|nr:hypothetical protein AVEN_204262-1 [Araneus ventricosus]